MIISLRMSQVHGDGWGIMAHDNMLNNHRDHLGYRCANQDHSRVQADSDVLTIAGVPLRFPLTDAGTSPPSLSWHRFCELRKAIDQNEGGLEKFSRGVCQSRTLAAVRAKREGSRFPVALVTGSFGAQATRRWGSPRRTRVSPTASGPRPRSRRTSLATSTAGAGGEVSLKQVPNRPSSARQSGRPQWLRGAFDW